MSNQARSEAAFDAMGDPMRRRIAETLGNGALPVGELADRLPIGRPAVSKHLKVLESAGIVEHTSIGTRNLYALAPGGLAPLQVWIAKTWDDVLSEFVKHVENGERT
ncbi:DNA-binding transcriptional ArsR family regulator [Aeromicrobium panaciterrae]|uniref:DNA-binding transcriptional ArsR family regulator n=1 Tax=Aeromicrobium panaciterrae TaxID=363861 RepID=A0ABU1UKZ1_9ACTN|nr:metalloregulator ArsR/SmtB family transcription factor [Aeromicrobium panaciterrae]MDR7085819.1 DNA-binding transcriptional ArsR family regulator [Aeromicrobium panaciterrae]